MTRFHDKETHPNFELLDVDDIEITLRGPKFEELYQRENVYIEKKLAEAVNKIAKKKGKGGKMEIYNAALRLYIQKIMLDAKKQK